MDGKSFNPHYCMNKDVLLIGCKPGMCDAGWTGTSCNTRGKYILQYIK